MPSVNVIVPTKNEEANIQKLLSQILPYGYEVIVVDDSDDATADIAISLGARVIKGRGLGLAQAVLDGIDATEGEYIIVMDSDLQHPSQMLPQIVKQLKFHDLVVMTKHTKEAMAELSWWRKLQSNLGVFTANFFIPAPVSDPMTGFFGIRRKCLDGIPRCTGYKIDYKKLSKLKKKDSNKWKELENSKPKNFGDISELEQGKWYYERGYAIETVIYYKVEQEKLDKLKVKNPDEWDNLEKGKPANWNGMDATEQGEWYDKRGFAIKLVGLEAIGFKIGLELFTKAKWVSHREIPISFMKREAGQSKGTAHSLHKHLWRLLKNSFNYEVELPKGSEEYHYFYEGSLWQQEWKQEIALRIKGITKEAQSKRILDIGCGSSPNINYIKGERIGIDINTQALEYMKSHSDAQFDYGSILDIPFTNESFDTVLCIEVLEHLYPTEIEKAISELVRVLCIEGYAIIATPNYSSFWWNTIEKAQQLFQRKRWTSDHHTHFNRATLDNVCLKNGLKEVRYDSVMGNMDMIVTYQKVTGD
jgi:dolichol-phosphate mannosyltransferase